jgi:hypothetical protein
MNDLFNFDDTMPSDGSSLMAGSGSGAPGGTMPGPGAEDTYSDEGGDEGYYTDDDEAYEGSGYAEDEEYSSQYGNVDTTLFARVHERHLKCLQKGLILVTREEIPE